jgi:hypothetical protein
MRIPQQWTNLSIEQEEQVNGMTLRMAARRHAVPPLFAPDLSAFRR